MTITPLRLTQNKSNDNTPNMTATAMRDKQKSVSQIMETRGARITDPMMTEYNQKSIKQILETRDGRKTTESKISDFPSAMKKLDGMNFLEENRFLGVEVEIDEQSNKPRFGNPNIENS